MIRKNNMKNTLYEAEEPLPVSPVNEYKKPEEAIEVTKAYKMHKNFSTVIKRNEINTTHMRVHIGCKYSRVRDKRNHGENAERLHFTFKQNCPYLVEVTYIKKNDGYKIANSNVLSDLAHNHPLNIRTLKRASEYRRRPNQLYGYFSLTLFCIKVAWLFFFFTPIKT